MNGDLSPCPRVDRAYGACIFVAGHVCRYLTEHSYISAGGNSAWTSYSAR